MSTVLYGVGLSPFVRKVRLALELKGMQFEHNQVTPFSDDKPAEFVENSPLGKIPLLKIDDIYIPDSAVILSYLERTRTDTPLLPNDDALVARALWFEAYMGSQMVPSIGGHLFVEQVLAPAVFGRESNVEEMELAKNVEIPAIFDYLEGQLDNDFLVGQTPGHADVCVGGSFISMLHCDFQCDASQWPKTAAYIDRLMAVPAFETVRNEEVAILNSLAG